MNIHLILSGNELLNGVQLDTNLRFIGGELAAAGIPVRQAVTIGDSRPAMIDALAALSADADALIVTGGLGSTDDDITRQVAAEFFGMPLHRNDDLARYVAYCYRTHHPDGPIPKAIFRQAEVPEGARILPNRNGSAAGLCLDAAIGDRHFPVFLLPGPPRELEPLFRECVLPELLRLRRDPGLFRCGMLTLGIGEIELQQRLADFPLPPETGIAYCAVPGGTRLFLTAPDRDAAVRQLTAFRATLPAPQPEPGETELAPALIRKLKAAGLTCGLAESCTGGMAAAEIVAIPGSSAVFRGGIICYHNDIKTSLLGVPPAVLENHGAVSAACAEAMARGAARQLGVDLAGAITGIAGPDGGTGTKPVGTVFCAVACGGNVTIEEQHFSGDRATIRTRSAAHLLKMLFQLCP